MNLLKRQSELKQKHGDPYEFMLAAKAAVPDFASSDEADSAIRKYRTEWNIAGWLDDYEEVNELVRKLAE